MSLNPDGELKKTIRKEILQVRSCLSGNERDDKNRAICAKLIEMPEFSRAGLVMAYMDFRDEPGTADIISECFKRGKRVALPVVTGKGGAGFELQAFETVSGAVLLRNSYGIFEPDPNTACRVDEAEIDLVIVPGVVFDLMKYRIGYGAGYYDRFLKKLGMGCFTVGIAYDLQIVDWIPAENHDIPMNKVITESHVIL